MTTRRLTDWQDTDVNVTLADGGTDLVSLNGALSVVETRGATVTRLLIALNMFEAALNQGKAVQRVYWGIGVAAQEAFVLGTTAIPDPNVPTDKPRLDWLAKGMIIVASGSTATDRPVPIYTRELDIRSSRKIENGELYLTFNNDNLLGFAFAVEVIGLVRALFIM